MCKRSSSAWLVEKVWNRTKVNVLRGQKCWKWKLSKFTEGEGRGETHLRLCCLSWKQISGLHWGSLYVLPSVTMVHRTAVWMFQSGIDTVCASLRYNGPQDCRLNVSIRYWHCMCFPPLQWSTGLPSECFNQVLTLYVLPSVTMVHRTAVWMFQSGIDTVCASLRYNGPQDCRLNVSIRYWHCMCFPPLQWSTGLPSKCFNQVWTLYVLPSVTMVHRTAVWMFQSGIDTVCASLRYNGPQDCRLNVSIRYGHCMCFPPLQWSTGLPSECFNQVLTLYVLPSVTMVHRTAVWMLQSGMDTVCASLRYNGPQDCRLNVSIKYWHCMCFPPLQWSTGLPSECFNQVWTLYVLPSVTMVHRTAVWMLQSSMDTVCASLRYNGPQDCRLNVSIRYWHCMCFPPLQWSTGLPSECFNQVLTLYVLPSVTMVHRTAVWMFQSGIDTVCASLRYNGPQDCRLNVSIRYWHCMCFPPLQWSTGLPSECFNQVLTLYVLPSVTMVHRTAVWMLQSGIDTVCASLRYNGPQDCRLNVSIKYWHCMCFPPLQWSTGLPSECFNQVLTLYVLPSVTMVHRTAVWMFQSGIDTVCASLRYNGPQDCRLNVSIRYWHCMCFPPLQWSTGLPSECFNQVWTLYVLPSVTMVHRTAVWMFQSGIDTVCASLRYNGPQDCRLNVSIRYWHCMCFPPLQWSTGLPSECFNQVWTLYVLPSVTMVHRTAVWMLQSSMDTVCASLRYNGPQDCRLNASIKYGHCMCFPPLQWSTGLPSECFNQVLTLYVLPSVTMVHRTAVWMLQSSMDTVCASLRYNGPQDCRLNVSIRYWHCMCFPPLQWSTGLPSECFNQVWTLYVLPSVTMVHRTAVWMFQSGIDTVCASLRYNGPQDCRLNVSIRYWHCMCFPPLQWSTGLPSECFNQVWTLYVLPSVTMVHRTAVWMLQSGIDTVCASLRYNGPQDCRLNASIRYWHCMCFPPLQWSTGLPSECFNQVLTLYVLPSVTMVHRTAVWMLQSGMDTVCASLRYNGPQDCRLNASIRYWHCMCFPPLQWSTGLPSECFNQVWTLYVLPSVTMVHRTAVWMFQSGIDTVCASLRYNGPQDCRLNVSIRYWHCMCFPPLQWSTGLPSECFNQVLTLYVLPSVTMVHRTAVWMLQSSIDTVCASLRYNGPQDCRLNVSIRYWHCMCFPPLQWSTGLPSECFNQVLTLYVLPSVTMVHRTAVWMFQSGIDTVCASLRYNGPQDCRLNVSIKYWHCMCFPPLQWSTGLPSECFNQVLTLYVLPSVTMVHRTAVWMFQSGIDTVCASLRYNGPQDCRLNASIRYGHCMCFPPLQWSTALPSECFNQVLTLYVLPSVTMVHRTAVWMLQSSIDSVATSTSMSHHLVTLVLTKGNAATLIKHCFKKLLFIHLSIYLFLFLFLIDWMSFSQGVPPQRKKSCYEQVSELIFSILSHKASNCGISFQ